MEQILVSGAGVQSRTLGFQGKNLQDSVAEVVDVADGLANSGRQEDEVRGRQAGADNLPRAIAMNVLTLHLSKLRTSHIQIISELWQIGLELGILPKNRKFSGAVISTGSSRH